MRLQGAGRDRARREEEGEKVTPKDVLLPPRTKEGARFNGNLGIIILSRI